MVGFRLFLVLGWLALAAFIVIAAGQQPLGETKVFFTDIALMGWRGAFNLDFICHLLLLALWVMWRHRFSPLGILWGVLCLCGGALFSFIYLLVVSVRSKGDMQRLLLGDRIVVAR